jgi:hypothetical protein
MGFMGIYIDIKLYFVLISHQSSESLTFYKQIIKLYVLISGIIKIEIIFFGTYICIHLSSVP